MDQQEKFFMEAQQMQQGAFGKPPSSGGSSWVWFILLLLLAGGGGWAAWHFKLIPDGKASKETETVEEEATQPPTAPDDEEHDGSAFVPEPVAEKKPLLDDADVAILSFYQEEAEDKETILGALLISVVNAAKGPKKLPVVNATLLDEEGREYAPLNQGSSSRKVNPGLGVTHAYSFLLPKGSGFPYVDFKVDGGASCRVPLIEPDAEEEAEQPARHVQLTEDAIRVAEARWKAQRKLAVPKVVSNLSPQDQKRLAKEEENLKEKQKALSSVQDRVTELQLRIEDSEGVIEKVAKKAKRYAVDVRKYSREYSDYKKDYEAAKKETVRLDGLWRKATRHERIRLGNDISRARQREAQLAKKVKDYRDKYYRARDRAEDAGKEIKDLEKKLRTLTSELKSKGKTSEKLEREVKNAARKVEELSGGE